MTPIFEDFFYKNGSLFYASSHSNWSPLSAEKIGLSLSYLVPEILGPKVVLIFFIYLSLFDPSFLQNLSSKLIQIFMLNPLSYWKFGEVPPGGGAYFTTSHHSSACYGRRILAYKICPLPLSATYVSLKNCDFDFPWCTRNQSKTEVCIVFMVELDSLIMKYQRVKYYRCTVIINDWYSWAFQRPNQYSLTILFSCMSMSHPQELSNGIMPHPKQASMLKFQAHTRVSLAKCHQL